MNNVTFGDGSVGYYETVAGGAGAVSLPTLFSMSIVRQFIDLSQTEQISF